MRSVLLERTRAQHGLITRQQFALTGISARQVRHQRSQGEWILVYPPVFRHAAHPVTPEQRILATCLCYQMGAVASHQSAAWLWGLLPVPPGRLAVTVVKGASPRLYDFDVHRSNDLHLATISVRRNIECTNPLRTLVDLAAVADGRTLEGAIDRALATRLVTVTGLRSEADRLSRRGRRGVLPLRSHLTGRGLVGAPSPSVLESRTLDLLHRYQIPVQRGEKVSGLNGEYRIDFWLVAPVALEVDGYAWHFSPEHKARDEYRRNQLRLDGTELYVADWQSVLHRGPTIARMLQRAIRAHQS